MHTSDTPSLDLELPSDPEKPVFANTFQTTLYEQVQDILVNLRSLPKFLSIPPLHTLSPKRAFDDNVSVSDVSDHENEQLEAGPEVIRLSQALNSMVHLSFVSDDWKQNISITNFPSLLRDHVHPCDDISLIPHASDLLSKALASQNSGNYKMSLCYLEQASEVVEQFEQEISKEDQSGTISVENAKIYIYNAIGSVHCSQEKYEEALVAFHDAKGVVDDIMQRVYNTLNTAHPTNAVVHSNLGIACFHLQKQSLALICHYAALEMRLDLYGPSDPEYPEVALSLNNLGVCLVALGRFDEAFVFLSSAFTICWKFLPHSHPRLDVILRNLQKIKLQTRHLTIRGNLPALRVWRVFLKPWEMPELAEKKGKGKKGKGKGKKKK